MVCDLGVSRVCVSDAKGEEDPLGQDALMKTRVGTPLFLSPEVVMRRPYCKKVDVWAMGCLIYTLLGLKAPFMGHNLIDLAQAITKKAPQRLPDQYSHELKYTVGQVTSSSPHPHLILTSSSPHPHLTLSHTDATKGSFEAAEYRRGARVRTGADC